jgi:hypothetical protein
MDSISDLCQSVTVLPGYHQGRLFEGERAGYPLATDAGARRSGWVHTAPEFAAVPEKINLNPLISEAAAIPLNYLLFNRNAIK